MSSDSDSNDDEKFAAQGSTVRRNWDESFEALIAFKKKFGHVLVPSSYAEDSALGHWVRFLVCCIHSGAFFRGVFLSLCDPK